MSQETEWSEGRQWEETSIAGAVVAVVVVLGIKHAKATEIPAHAFEDDVVSLRLFNAPCENAEAKALAGRSPLASLADKLQRADSNWLVQTPVGGFRLDFSGCWVEYTHNGKQGYAVAFEDGEIRFFPAESFKKVKGGTGA